MVKLKEAIERVKSGEKSSIRVLDKGIKVFPMEELAPIAQKLDSLTLSNNNITGKNVICTNIQPESL